MTSPLPTNIYEIGKAVKSRLVLLNVVKDPAQIIWSARRVMPHIQGKLDIVLRPRRQQNIFEKGGGRYGIVMVRIMDIFVRTSYGGTELGDDETWYAQHVPVEDALVNALATQMLTDPDGNDYLTSSIKYLGAMEEQKEVDVGPKNLWGDSSHSFELHWKPKFDLSQMT